MPRESGSSSKKWEMLDIVSNEGIAETVEALLCSLRCTNGDFKKTLAVNGGLVYEMHGEFYERRHIVCNPVTKDIYQITKPKHHILFDRDFIVMSVDHATQSHKIIIGGKSYRIPEHRGGVYLYASKTLEWRTLCKVPIDGFGAQSSVFLKGALFTLLIDVTTAPWCPKVYACDLESRDWSYINVDLPQLCHPQDRLQLVVSLDRLFLVVFTGGPSSDMTIWTYFWYLYQTNKNLCNATISEILFNEREVKKVAEMPKYVDQDLRRMGDKHRPRLYWADQWWGLDVETRLSFHLWLPVAVWDMTC